MSRNVILVTADSLRADYCGFMDGDPTPWVAADESLTPTLDSLAETGIVYESAMAPGPRTPSSMPVIFSGVPLSPVALDSEDYWQRLRTHIRSHLDRYGTLAARFQDRGYETVGITVNPWTDRTGFERGFDRYHYLNSDNLAEYGSVGFKLLDTVLRGNRLGNSVKWFNKREWFIRWVDYYQTIRDELRTVDEPYFLWVFLLDTHQPYIAPESYRDRLSGPEMYYATFRELLSEATSLPDHVERRLQLAYAASIRSVDAFVNELVTDSEVDDPVVAIHSDHGEAFGTHGSYGHERQLYRENLHVPLLLADARRRSGERVEAPITLQQLPCLLDAVSTASDVDPTRFTEDYVISGTEDCLGLAVQSLYWKYISSEVGEELYDLRNDAGERSNCATEYPQITQMMRDLVQRRRHHLRERDAIADATTTVDF